MARLTSWLGPFGIAIPLVGPIYLAGLAIRELTTTELASSSLYDPPLFFAATIVTAIVAWFIAPSVAPSFGRMLRSWRRPRYRIPDNVAETTKGTYVVLIVLASCQFICELLAAWITRSNASATAANFLWLIPATVVLVAAGFGIVQFGDRLFLNSRGRKLDSWIDACDHHIALSNVIGQWDNPSKNIFGRCRISRRVATAYRAILLVAAGLFSTAGVLATVVSTQSWFGEVLLIGCIAATLSLWPTQLRLVTWSKNMIYGPA